MIKDLLVASVSCLVCVNTYATTLTQDEIKTRLKGLTKIDYGIWAYEKIAPQKDSHWIKQPGLFNSAVTVIGDAISKILVNSDEFELGEDENPKELITFKANPEGYDRSNWNAFICYNFINQIVKASIKRQRNIDVEQIFKDIKQNALQHYKNANIKRLATQLDTSISDIKQYNDVLNLDGFLDSFGDLKRDEIRDIDYVIMSSNSRGLRQMDVRDLKQNEIWIQGCDKPFYIQKKGYSAPWWIKQASGLSYPLRGKFLGNACKFELCLKYDEKNEVWKASEITPFKKIKYLKEYEQKEVTKILYDKNHIAKNKDQIQEVEAIICDDAKPKQSLFSSNKKYKYEDTTEAAKDIVKGIITDNKAYTESKKKELPSADFWARFDITAWEKEKETVKSDLKAVLEPIGLELDEEKIFGD